MEIDWGAIAVTTQTVCAVIAVLLAGLQTAHLLKRLFRRLGPKGARTVRAAVAPTASIASPLSGAEDALPPPALRRSPQKTMWLLWSGFFVLMIALFYSRAAAVGIGLNLSVSNTFGYALVLLFGVYLATRQPGPVPWLTPVLGYLVAAAAIAPLFEGNVIMGIVSTFGPDCIVLLAIAVASRIREDPLGIGAVFSVATAWCFATSNSPQVFACLIAAACFAVPFARARRGWVWGASGFTAALVAALEFSTHELRLASWTRDHTSTFADDHHWQARSYIAQWVNARPFGPTDMDIQSFDELSVGWLVFLARVTGWVPAVLVLGVLAALLAITVLAGLHSARTRPQVLALALVPAVFFGANVLVQFGAVPTFPVTPPPFSSAAGAAWLAILIASIRSPVLSENRVEWKQVLRHPLMYFGVTRDANVPANAGRTSSRRHVDTIE
ncbi:hypothetical protein JOF42_000349 [Microbacterium phyllosphaerae]|uniref:Uncharacterized protein n=1 Tax=Microbacterium phyllosphaerae TaxID=124798 RepID=A0ABS4WMU9_9MICO|nr:hypothetical protein [Microbacterium phyllosphaerae]MBP2376854.1 hypothetical protein [Microbacterium phyllosphaerae]